MSIALYRKYRSANFDEIIGQDHIVQTLKRALQEGKVGHAFLFSGSRGLGKTSIARILARELGVRERDVYEIDAASNRGIDDIRALREEISTLPFESPYKFYIIDECHMLTKEAFNALLKTLEEPPLHAKFVLATTEMHKLPDTIISRCEVHHFAKPTRAVLAKHIEHIARKEGYELETSGALLIATLGEGSYRDALGVLQKVLASVEEKKISEEDVEKITGSPTSASVTKCIQALDTKDINAFLDVVHKAAQKGIDMKLFSELIIQKLRYVLLLRHASHMSSFIKEEVGSDDFDDLKKVAENKSSFVRASVLARFLEVPKHIELSAIPELPLELAIMELCGNE